MYDISREITFDDAKNWVKELENQAPDDVIIAIVGWYFGKCLSAGTNLSNKKKNFILLIGNKCDLEDIRQVKTQTGEEYASSIGAVFMETSAKSDVGISDLFNQLGQMYIRKMRRKSERIMEESESMDKVELTKENVNNNGNQQSKCKC